MSRKRKLSGLFAALTVLCTEVASAFYNPSVGRWLNRDPIGKRGDVNSYAFVLNSPAALVDPWGLKTISFNVSFDRNFDYSEELKYLHGQEDFFRQALSQCCTQFRIGCGNDVKFNYDWMNMAQDRDGTKNPGPNRILVTNDDLGGGRAGLGWEGGGASIHPGGPPQTMAHECGHIAGGCNYGGKDPIHSPDKNNLMNSGSSTGTRPDRCWCDNVNKLAK